MSLLYLMRYNGTDYNEQWVLSLTLEQFMNHISVQSVDKRHLETIYNIIHANNRQYVTGSGKNGSAIHNREQPD